MTRTAFLEQRHVDLHRAARKLAIAQLEPLEERAEEDLEGAAQETVALLAKGELLKHCVPKAYGGASETIEARSLIVAREGVAYGSGLADAMLALQALGAMPITLVGTPEQRKAHLPDVASGAQIAALAITEAEAGSDIASLATRATRTELGWEITGAKTLISNAGIASFYCVLAKTDPAAGAKGITCLLVPGDADGVTVEPLHGMAAHPLGTVRFDRVQVGPDALVGREGEGLRLAFTSLDIMRPTVGAAAVGFAQRGLDEAVSHARSRRQFGRALAENQGLRWKLAQAGIELDAARLVVHRAGWLKDTGEPRITYEAAAAKFLATETAQRVVDTAVQVRGGAGTLRGSVVERLYREVRALRIYEGTSEVLLEIAARSIVDEPTL